MIIIQKPAPHVISANASTFVRIIHILCAPSAACVPYHGKGFRIPPKGPSFAAIFPGFVITFTFSLYSNYLSHCPSLSFYLSHPLPERTQKHIAMQQSCSSSSFFWVHSERRGVFLACYNHNFPMFQMEPMRKNLLFAISVSAVVAVCTKWLILFIIPLKNHYPIRRVHLVLAFYPNCERLYEYCCRQLFVQKSCKKVLRKFSFSSGNIISHFNISLTL